MLIMAFLLNFLKLKKIEKVKKSTFGIGKIHPPCLVGCFVRLLMTGCHTVDRINQSLL